MRFAETIALAAALLSGACTSGRVAPDARVQAREGSFAYVAVDRVAVSDDAPAGPAEVRAIFARYQGVRGDEVLDLLGQDAPGGSVDACGGAAPGAGFVGASAWVELVDVGEIAVRVGGESTRLLPTTFPDLGSMVAGVHYAESTTLPLARPEADEYRIAVAGRGLVPPFDAFTVAPSAPEGVRIAGHAIDEAPIVLRGEDLVVQWEPVDPREVVEIVVRVDGRSARCRASDDGAFRVPGPVVFGLPASDDAKLVIRRVRYEPFDAATFDAGWLRLAASRAGTFTLR